MRNEPSNMAADTGCVESPTELSGVVVNKRLKFVAFGAVLAATAIVSGCSDSKDSAKPAASADKTTGKADVTEQPVDVPADGVCTIMKPSQAIVKPSDTNYQKTLADKNTSWYLPTFPADLKLHEVSWLERQEIDCSKIKPNQTMPKFPGVPMTQSAKVTQAAAKVTDDGTLEKAIVVGLEPQWTDKSFGLASEELKTMRSAKVQDVTVQGKPAKMFDIDIAANVLSVKEGEKFEDVPYFGFIVDNKDYGTVIFVRGYDEAEAKKIAEETDLKAGVSKLGEGWQELPTEAVESYPKTPSWRLIYKKPEKVREKPRTLTVNESPAGQWATSLISAAWRHPDSPAKLYVLGDKLAYRHGPAGAAEGFSLGAHFVTLHVDNNRQLDIAMAGMPDVDLPKFIESVAKITPDDKRLKPVDKTLVPDGPNQGPKPGATKPAESPSPSSGDTTKKP